MKKILGLLLLSILCSNSFAEMYRVNVKRVDNNLYQTTDGRYVIKTKYCYEYTYGEDVVLDYTKYSYNNKIIFRSGTTCEVEGIY